MNEKEYPMAKLIMPERAMYIKYSYGFKGARVKPHDHGVMEIVLIMKGTCTHYFEGKSHILIPGDFYVIHPTQIHAINMDTDCRWCDILVLTQNNTREQQEIFLLPDMQKLLYQNDPSLGYPLYHIPVIQREDILYLIKQIINEQDKQTENTEIRLRAYFCLLMTQFSQIVNISHTRLTLERNDVARILAYLEENFDRPIRIGSLAADMGFSESQLRRVFKEQTGFSPVDYLNHLRVQKAEIMLKSSEFTITEIAEKVGIYDTAYFSRLYKKYTKKSPSQDRVKNKEKII